MIRPRFPQGIDWVLAVVPLLLVAAGIAVIYSIAPAEGGRASQAVSQGIYALLGIGIFIFLASVDYRLFRAAAPALYGTTLLLLVLVLIVGSIQFGARRWIDLGPFQLQPSELMKAVGVITLAWFFASREEVKIGDLAAALLLIIAPVLLVLRQPDFGSALLLLAGPAPIFVLSRISREQWLGIAAVVVVVIPLIFFTLQPYQRARLETYLNPEQDPFGTGYNVLQSTIAIGAGGLTGRGLGQGSQSTLQFVPVAHTDFIFAGIAEATGFLGSATLLTLFAVLIARSFRLALLAQDRFGRLLSAGIASLWLFSVFINVGMNLGLVPVTGIPLPFVSFGGSSLLTNFALAGVLQSIHRRHRKINFR